MAFPIQYPIICFSQGTILSMPSSKKFLTCSTLEFKRGWYRNILMVDSAGRGYRIEGAEPLGHAGLFWGIRLFRRMIRVKPNVAKGPFDVSLEALKKRVYQYIDDDEAGWSEIAGIKDIKRAVKEATTHEALIALPYWME